MIDAENRILPVLSLKEEEAAAGTTQASSPSHFLLEIVSATAFLALVPKKWVQES